MKCEALSPRTSGRVRRRLAARRGPGGSWSLSLSAQSCKVSADSGGSLLSRVQSERIVRFAVNTE